MSYQAGRPENVLRRAEDLIAINEPTLALQSLYNFITAKRTKYINPTTPELVQNFKLFISIAIKNRLSKDIKDALYHYKRIVQTANTTEGYESLEQLAKFFLKEANSKLDEAQTQANDAAEAAIEENVLSAAAAQKVLDTLEEEEEVAHDEEEDDVEAFHFNVSPENILLSSVTTDDSTDRSNKEFFLPWLKFVWEAHRTVLELLKNNNKLETSYCQVILEAFQFCIKYERKAEFKRLCELLKNHLLAMSKPEFEDAVNLSNPDTLQKFLDTRFQQLNTAVKLELWKESFKSIDDVHVLMKISKRTPKPIALVNYYKNLAKIFQVSNDYIYATTARQKLFELLIQSPIITAEELKEHSTLYLITALSIPVSESSSRSFSVQNGLVDSEFYKRKNQKLTSLLNLKEVPTRESLLGSNTLKAVLKYADANIVALFNLLEKSFNPLTFNTSANKILNELASNDKYLSYTTPLKEVIVSKIISKVSTLYESIKFDFLYKISTFENSIFNYDQFTFEDLLVNGSFSNLIKSDVEIDDEAGVVSFTDKLYASPASRVNSRLFDLEKALSSAINLINVEQYNASKKELQNRLLQAANEQFAAEKENILKTSELIAQREEELRASKLEEKLENEKARQEAAIKQRKAEEERIQQEAERRERERIEKTTKMIEMDNKKQIVANINASGIIHIKFEDVKDMSEDDIRKLQIKKLEEESNKLEEKTQAIVKRADYIERAQRQYEIPLLEKEFEHDVVKQREEYEVLKKKNEEQSKAAHEQALQIKERLSRFVPVFEEYSNKLAELSVDVRKEKELKIKEKLEAAKKARIAEFIEEKKKEFLEAQQREKEAAKAKAMAEAQAAAEAKMYEAQNRAREEALKARQAAMGQASSSGRYTPPTATPSRYTPPTAAPSRYTPPTAAPSRYTPPTAVPSRASPSQGSGDPERADYEALKTKGSLSMSERLKLKRLVAKFE